MTTTLLRSLAICFALAFAATSAEAAVPGRVTFTARLVDNGAPVTGAIQVKLDLFRAQTGGTSVWTESHTTTASDGLVSIGMGEQLPFDPVVLDGALFLEVTVGSTVLSPRLAIGSVPYALRADSADKLGELAADDLQRRIFGTCPSGSSIQSIDAAGAVTCETDDDSKNTFGAGLIDNGGAVSVDAAFVQRRVTGACPAGSSINAIAADGTTSCEVDDNTPVSAGAGVLISSTGVVSTDNNFVQRRVSGSCPAGSSIRFIDSVGNVSCEADTDTDTTYSASCGTGQFVRSLSSTGAATCGALTGSAAFTVIAANSTTQVSTVIGARAFCALTRVEAINSDDPECRLTFSGTSWTLIADGSSGIGSIVTCEARCF